MSLTDAGADSGAAELARGQVRRAGRERANAVAGLAEESEAPPVGPHSISVLLLVRRREFLARSTGGSLSIRADLHKSTTGMGPAVASTGAGILDAG